METILLRGGPGERGYLQGLALRGSIAALWDRYRTDVFTELPEKDVAPVLERMVAFLDKNVPGIVEELEGIARGAGLSFDEVAKLNFGSAIKGVLSSRRAFGDSCSCVAIEDTPDGAVIAKNTDLGPQADCFYALKIVIPDKGIPYLGYGEVGGPWIEAGVNAEGLCIGQASTMAQRGQDGYGLPVLHAVHLAMQHANRTMDAAAYLGSLVHAGTGVNLMVADREGIVVALERAHDRQALRKPADGVLCFTNHFVSPEMQSLVAPLPRTANSYDRLERYHAIFAHEHPRRSAEGIVKVISDHGGHPHGPCQHGDTGMYTRYACVLLPRRSEMRLFRGPSCSTQPESYFIR